MIGEHLWTRGQADPDLVIRTSGRQRLSDFMIWQSAHSRFYFVEALYPDLREVDFLRALRDYSAPPAPYGALNCRVYGSDLLQKGFRAPRERCGLPSAPAATS